AFVLVDPIEIAVDLELGVVDRVIQPGPFGPGQRVPVAAEDRVLEVFEGAVELRWRDDRGGFLGVGRRLPEAPLAGRGGPRGWRPGRVRCSRGAAAVGPSRHPSSIAARGGPSPSTASPPPPPPPEARGPDAATAAPPHPAAPRSESMARTAPSMLRRPDDRKR